MFTPELVGWRTQYERMLRGVERLKRPYISSTDYLDDLQHFLQDCWHLKDWIKNDPEIGIGKRIEDEVKAEEALRIVGDLATACKHLNHDDRDARGNGERAYATGNDVTSHLGQTRPVDVVLRIKTGDGRVISDKELIERATSTWDAVLRRLALIT